MASAYPFVPSSGSFIAAPSAYYQQQQQQAAYGGQAGYGSGYPAYGYGAGQMAAQTSAFAVPTSGSFTYGGGAPAGPPRTNSFTYNTPAAVPTTGSFAYAADPYANASTSYGFQTPSLFGYGGGASYGGAAPYAGSGYPNSMLPGSGSFASTPQFQFFAEPSSGSGTAPEGGHSSSAGNSGTGPIPSGDGPSSARPSRPDGERAGRPPLAPAKQVPLTPMKLKKKKTCGCC